MVAINELITGVNIALGTTPLAQCPSFDADGNGEVGINELITAVNNALGTCAMPPVEVERVFTVDPGVLLADPSGTSTGLFTSGLSGPNAANSFSPGPLTLLLGVADSSGVASLRLKEDVTIDISVIDGSRLCFQMLAADSDGSIDCDGGTAYDTRGTQPAGDVGFPFAIETDLGEPAGPGNGNLLVPVLYQLLPIGDATPCADVVYTNPLQTFPFTTTKATSVKGSLILTVSGAPFDCENFGTPGSGGQLAAPAPATQAPIGDVSNVFRFGELPPTQ
ncbi:MAG: hypothetical protein ABI629_15625 [bacterium]